LFGLVVEMEGLPQAVINRTTNNVTIRFIM